MSFTCTNLPPPLLNGKLSRTGNIVDYVCAEGFSMTSGSQRVACTGTNTWTPNMAPTCSIIERTISPVFPTWLAILCACLLFVILFTCLTLALVAICCGTGEGGGCRRCCGRCCGQRRHRTRPSTADSLDDSYHGDRRYYDNAGGYGSGVYYQNGYDGKRVESRTLRNPPYILPGNAKTTAHGSPQQRVQYIMVEPSSLKSKQTITQKRDIKVRQLPDNVINRSGDVARVVQQGNGRLVPLDKYLKENPRAQLVTVGDRDMMFQQGTGSKTDPKPAVRNAWRANNKRTPPIPSRSPRDQTAADHVVVMVVNDLNDTQPEQDKDKKKAQKGKPDKEDEVKGPHDDSPTSDTTTKSSPTSDADNTYSTDVYHPSSAMYIRSGSSLDFEADKQGVPPLSTRPGFKRTAFTTRDYNRFRPAKEVIEWSPHTKPVRNNNTSTM